MNKSKRSRRREENLRNALENAKWTGGNEWYKFVPPRGHHMRQVLEDMLTQLRTKHGMRLLYYTQPAILFKRYNQIRVIYELKFVAGCCPSCRFIQFHTPYVIDFRDNTVEIREYEYSRSDYSLEFGQRNKVVFDRENVRTLHQVIVQFIDETLIKKELNISS